MEPEDFNLGAELPEVDPILEQESGQEQAAPATLASEMYKILVDGEEEEVDLETLKKNYSHGKAAGKRMSEAGRLKDDATRLLEMLRQDPLKVRQELDPDFKETDFLTKRLAELMEEQMLTPEQKQERQDRQELQEWREKKKQEKEEIEAKELQEHMNIEIERLDTEFAAAFETVGLPKTNEMRKRLASLMLEDNEAGHKTPAVELAKQVKKEAQQELMELLKSSDDEAFEAILGSDLLSRSQKVALKKVKTPGNRSATPVVRRDPPEDDKRKYRTRDDLLKDFGID